MQSIRMTHLKSNTKETKTAISTLNSISFKSANHNHITLIII